MKAIRLGSPVRGSVTAVRASSSRNARPSWMSSIWPIMKRGSPWGVRTIEPLIATHVSLPSAHSARFSRLNRSSSPDRRRSMNAEL